MLENAALRISLVSILLMSARESSAQILYAIDSLSTLYYVSQIDATLAPIGSTGVFLAAGLEFGPDGQLYTFPAGQGEKKIYRINPATAEATPVVTLAGDPFLFEGALAFSDTGTLFAVNGASAQSSKLLTFDLTTGAVTEIGVISGGEHDINGLAWRSDGKLIGLDRITNSLLVIDPVTAVSSQLAPVGTLVGPVGGMTSLGQFGYFATGGGEAAENPDANVLYGFNLFTGLQIPVGVLDQNVASLGLSGLAIIPEVSPITYLVIVGALGLLVRVGLRPRNG